jgi:hypothetical protein
MRNYFESVTDHPERLRIAESIQTYDTCTTDDTPLPSVVLQRIEENMKNIVLPDGKNPEQIRAEMQRIVHMAIIVIFGLVGFGVLVNAHESQKAKNLQAKRVQNANRIQ